MTTATSFEIESLESGNGKHLNAHGKVATWQSTCVVLVAEVIGVGVLGLPYVFLKCGWVVGFLALSLLCLTNMYSGFLLHRLFLQFPTVTRFADFGRLVGPWTGRVSSGVATLMAGGLATLDFLVAAQSLQVVVAAATSARLSLVQCSLAVLGVMLPVVQIQSLHGLVWLTVVGVTTIALPLVIVIAKLCSTYGLSDSAQVWPPASENTLARRVAPIFTIVFAYFGSVVQVQLQAEMRRPQEYAKVIRVSSAFFFVVYAGASAVVYALMGADTTSKITSQLAGADEAALRGGVNAMLFVHACVALAINACVTNKVLAETVASSVRPATSAEEEAGAEAEKGGSGGKPANRQSSLRGSRVEQDPAESVMLEMGSSHTGSKVAAAAAAPPPPSSRPPPSRAVWFGASASMLVLYFVVANSLTSFGGLLDVLSASLGMAMLYILPCIFALRLLDGVSALERLLLQATLVAAVVFAAIATYATAVVLAEDMKNSDERPWS